MSLDRTSPAPLHPLAARWLPAPRMLAIAVIVTAASWVIAAGLKWGTLAAGGADSYGYISQASLWLRGDLIVAQPLAREVPWPDADWTLAPLGYRPGLDPGTIVPVYAAGLPIVMAALQALAGSGGVYLAVPLLGGVVVMAATGLAWRLAGPPAAAMAAVLIASSPMVIFSSMWPMSDVPAAGWWGAALVLAAGTGIMSAAGAGLAAALAVLTRPNLAGLVIAPAMFLVVRLAGGAERRTAAVRLGLFVVAAAAGAIAVAALHTMWYGGPLRTGHGPASEVYALGYASANLWSYLTGPVRFEPALALLALAAVVIGRGRFDAAEHRMVFWLCVGTILLVLGSYAFYPPSPDWWYFRFLLPAYPAAAALGGAGAVRLAGIARGGWRALALGALAAVVVVVGGWQARERGAFDLRETESRYEAVGRFVRESLPASAVLLAFQQSGSLRLYAGRMTVRFDLLNPNWLDRAIDDLRARGYRPYFVIEEPEKVVFKSRFRPSPLALLDWPPVAELRPPVRVQIFDPADRERWTQGQARFPRQIPR